MDFECRVLSRNIQQALYDNQKTLGTAESCTGGRIAEAVISVPGASNYFKGGVVAYSDEVKEKMLGVPHSDIESHTAVSEQVAVAMAEGLCRAMGVDYAIATTGAAGPAGGTPEAPVGTIWIAYGAAGDMETFKLTEDFGRDINLSIATNKALRLFLNYLKERQPEEDHGAEG